MHELTEEVLRARTNCAMPNARHANTLTTTTPAMIFFQDIFTPAPTKKSGTAAGSGPESATRRCDHSPTVELPGTAAVAWTAC